MSVRALVVAVAVLCATVGTATPAIDDEIVELSAPLEADDPCLGSDEGECSVSLRQLRGLRLQGTGGGVVAAGEAGEEELSSPPLGNASEVGASGGTPCLCLFDVDRTLTGRQGSAGPGRTCTRNRVVPGVSDTAYDGGPLTLSELSVAGIASTFCGACYLGTISAGTASGHGEQSYLMSHVLQSGPMRSLASRNPSIMVWSYANHIRSPFVLAQADRTKQYAVPHILNVYKSNGIDIPHHKVYFFGDRGENIPYFRYAGVNAKEISCASRDHGRGDVVGYCGATPAEVVPISGISMCR